jgi:hypothetical protein
MIEPIELHIDGKNIVEVLMPAIEEAIQQAISTRPPSDTVKFPYRCIECDAEFWMNFHDIMRLTEPPNAVMPCGHEWGNLDFRRAVTQIVEMSE